MKRRNHRITRAALNRFFNGPKALSDAQLAALTGATRQNKALDTGEVLQALYSNDLASGVVS
jgi:hypothetical protein